MSADAVVPPAGGRVVQGRVRGPGRQGLPDLFVEVVDRVIGGDVGVGASQTDADGAFAVVVSSATQSRPDLQVRVWTNADPGATFVGASETAYDVTEVVVPLDVVLEPGSVGLETEYDGLLRTVGRVVGDRLGRLEESDSRSEISQLAAKTGWDARGLAYATLADRLAAETGDAIAAPFFYSLLRAGLPSAPELLFRTNGSTAEVVWRDAVETGVVSRDLADGIPGAVTEFEKQASSRLLASRATGMSSVEEILDLTFPGDADAKAAVAALRVRADGPDAFWTSVESTFKEAADRLKLDSRLASLTLDNAALLSALHAEQGQSPDGALRGADDLARRGFFRPAKWRGLIADAIPDSLPGENAEERKDNYADFLAAQVRLGYPTAVIAAKVADGELVVADSAEVREGVAGFLRDNVGRFELGVEPVRGFVAANDDVNLPDDPQVVEWLDRLSRVYQITPDDDSLAVLLEQGLDSATAIAAVPASEFVKARSADLGEARARLIHGRAEQISEVVTNLAADFLTARTAPRIGVDGAILTPFADEAAGTVGTPVLPTLEGLFGSLNTEACEHCGSMLSPAAYLVDLLEFLNFDNSTTGVNPLTKLLERRPDIGNLPLTCENTNTLVPHIDLVTETIEHFVTHNLSLSGFSGHSNPEGQTSDEALAGPAFVDDDAYEILQKTWYPSPLPFHRHLEELRALLTRLGVPLAEAMRILRRNDEDPAGGNAQVEGYGWREIAREQVGISAPLARVLTDRTIALTELLGYPDTADTEDVLADLGTVRGWATTLHLTYQEVDRLLGTRFVNPGVTLVAAVRLLGVNYATLKRLKGGQLSPAEFGAMLPDGLDEELYDGDAVAWVTDDARFRLITGLLVARRPAPLPDDKLKILPPFDQFVVGSADPEAAEPAVTAVVARRLVRFVRLWRTLGWSVEATDSAVAALLADRADDLGVVTGVGDSDLDVAMDVLLGRLGTFATVLRRLDLDPEQDLQALLACWSTLETWGADTIYRRLFLTRAGHDVVFSPDAVGRFLARPPKLKSHMNDICAALGVGLEDLALAVKGAGLRGDADLDLDSASKLFRRVWLARTLGMAQADFEHLLTVAEIDPFDLPDQPGSGMVRLLDLVDALSAAGVTGTDAVAALWPARETSPERLDPIVLQLARDVRGRRRTANAALQTGEPISAERVSELLELRFGPSGRHFDALVSHALDLDVHVDIPAGSDFRLSDAVIEASDGRLSYDAARQQLSYAGAMSDSVRTAVKNAAQSPAVVDTAVDALFDASEKRKQADGAFAQLGADLTGSLREYPEFRERWVAHLKASGDQSLASLLDDLVNDVRVQRRRDDAVAAVASSTEIPSALAQDLLLHKDLLGTTEAVVGVVEKIGEPGLEDDTDGAETTYSGWIDIAGSGDYRFGVRVAGAASVRLEVDHVSIELERTGELRRAKLAQPVAGDRLVPVKLVVEGADEDPELEWHVGSQSWSVVPEEVLYGTARVEALRRVLARCLAARLVDEVFGLGQAGLTLLAGRQSLEVEGQGWLGALPVLGSEEQAPLGAVLEALVGFARLVSLVEVDAPTLARLLVDAGAPGDDRSVFAAVLGWDSDALSALLDHRGRRDEDLADIGELGRVADAMRLASTLETPMSVLLSVVTPEPDADAVRQVEAALRSRYGTSWLEVLKTVSDPLRVLRRDALVAYVLREVRDTRPDVDTPEKLLDFFLMDVQMQPPVATSRVRHAIAAVQLYVERILMNLEEVHPEDLSQPERWQYLKRYRLWEANRQLYLWPENWLEPQLRTDQSPAFRRVMSELLQRDITEDAAATALLGYLSQLEEVAKLEPCAIHVDEGDPDLGDEVSHVVARTPGAQRRYYYRLRDSESWTAWEQVGLDIEDNPVMPVIWKGRRLLFWLRIVNTSPPMPPMDPAVAGKQLTEVTVAQLQDPSARNPKVQPRVVLCWSEYYNQRWQPPRTSDVAAPSSFAKDFDIVGEGAFDRAKVRLGVTIERGVLRVRIFGPGSETSFLFFNTFSLPQRREDGPSSSQVLPIDDFAKYIRDVDASSDILRLTYIGLDLQGAVVRPVVARIDGTPYRITAPYNIGYIPGANQQGLIRDPWLTPFLYNDGQHAFFVTTSSPVVGDGDAPGRGLPEPGLRGVRPPLLTPDELGTDFLLRFPSADLLAGDPTNVMVGDVEISPIGRTTRVLPASQEVHHG